MSAAYFFGKDDEEMVVERSEEEEEESVHPAPYIFDVQEEPVVMVEWIEVEEEEEEVEEEEDPRLAFERMVREMEEMSEETEMELALSDIFWFFADRRRELLNQEIRADMAYLKSKGD